jgi:hypothetical protein
MHCRLHCQQRNGATCGSRSAILASSLQFSCTACPTQGQPCEELQVVEGMPYGLSVMLLKCAWGKPPLDLLLNAVGPDLAIDSVHGDDMARGKLHLEIGRLPLQASPFELIFQKFANLPGDKKRLQITGVSASEPVPQKSPISCLLALSPPVLRRW